MTLPLLVETVHNPTYSKKFPVIVRTRFNVCLIVQVRVKKKLLPVYLAYIQPRKSNDIANSL